MKDLFYFFLSGLISVTIFFFVAVLPLKKENEELRKGCTAKAQWNITINGVTHRFDKDQNYIGTEKE